MAEIYEHVPWLNCLSYCDDLDAVGLGSDQRIDIYRILITAGNGVFFLRDNRQLKYSRTLLFRQHIYEKDCPVREREGIAMQKRRSWLDLAKSGDGKARTPGQRASSQQVSPIIFDLIVECEFSSRKKTCSNCPLFFRGKTTRRCAWKARCDKCVPNLSRTRCNSVQAIVAHGSSPTGLPISLPMIGIVKNDQRYLDWCQHIGRSLAPAGARLFGAPELPISDRGSHRVTRGNQRELAQERLKLIEAPGLPWNRNTRQLMAISIHVTTGG
jgi:hypothetical protein